MTAEIPEVLRPRRPSRVEGWFASYYRELGQFLRRYIRTPQDVDDCLQETFLRVWRQEQQGTLKDDARGYLFTTALNGIGATRCAAPGRMMPWTMNWSMSANPMPRRRRIGGTA